MMKSGVFSRIATKAPAASRSSDYEEAQKVKKRWGINKDAVLPFQAK